MKVVAIGTSSMWNKYNSSSFLIDDNILIDCPNGEIKNLIKMGLNISNIDNVLITHFHGDHYFDIPFYLLYKSRCDNNKSIIYCSKNSNNKINKLTKLAFPNHLKDVLNKNNVKYCFLKDFNIGEYNIKRLKVDHGLMKPCYGYIFKSENNMVGFTGDTALCSNVEFMCEVCNYLFCDCMFIEGTSKHMGIDNIEYLSKKYSNCTFIVTHLEDSTREKLKNLNIKNVIVPDDGFTIEI